MSGQKPSVGRIVHYVLYGECRAAVVTGVPEAADDTGVCDLVVLNPDGLVFTRGEQDEKTMRAGTWHWPERV